MQGQVLLFLEKIDQILDELNHAIDDSTNVIQVFNRSGQLVEEFNRTAPFLTELNQKMHLVNWLREQLGDKYLEERQNAIKDRSTLS